MWHRCRSVQSTVASQFFCSCWIFSFNKTVTCSARISFTGIFFFENNCRFDQFFERQISQRPHISGIVYGNVYTTRVSLRKRLFFARYNRQKFNQNLRFLLKKVFVTKNAGFSSRNKKISKTFFRTLFSLRPIHDCLVSSFEKKAEVEVVWTVGWSELRCLESKKKSKKIINFFGLVWFIFTSCEGNGGLNTQNNVSHHIVNWTHFNWASTLLSNCTGLLHPRGTAQSPIQRSVAKLVYFDYSEGVSEIKAGEHRSHAGYLGHITLYWSIASEGDIGMLIVSVCTH